MGEVVLSTEDVEVRTKSEATGRMGEELMPEEDCSGGGWKNWELFLPKMAIRVLLVEADDSTRQIITALLRKCNCRVAAISDGLKAWEIIKRKPHDIDLILTEVDLPSISGFALLTHIMENKDCKNIPVIMMSLQDSVSTVYKCMLRGAVDYLVKPLRRNELRNLWQHAWRKQSITIAGRELHREGAAHQKVEGTSENNAASNISSGYMACAHRNKDCTQKGVDAQSSCVKTDFEIESDNMENVREFLQPIPNKSTLCDMKIQEHDVNANIGQNMLMRNSEASGLQKNANTVITPGKDPELENCRRDGDIASEGSDNNEALVNSSREAIDLIGSFNNYQSCNYRNSSSDNGPIKFHSFSPPLDLSLRRSPPSDVENQLIEERHVINHSNVSAFTRYNSKPLPLPPLPSGVCSQQIECGANCKNNVVMPRYNSDTPTHKNRLSLTTDQFKQSEVTHSCPQQKLFPVPLPVKGIPFNNIGTSSYDSVLPPIFRTQSGPSMMQNQPSAIPQEPQASPFQPTNENHLERMYDPHGQDANDTTYSTMHKQEGKFDCLEEQRHISQAIDKSARGNFCNGTISHFTSIGYGSICGSNTNVDHVVVVSDAAESKNEGQFAVNINAHRSFQRDVALTKFRLKRKDRCYDKKVQYESRKKLAEQRPRVKGQFV